MIAKRRTRAAGYLRMSGDKQEKSPEQQKRELTALAEREGLEVVEWYADHAISGDTGTDRRPGLRRMLEGAERGEFEVLLVWHTNRFSRREPMDAVEDVNRLRRAGVQIITADRGRIDLNDFAQQLMWFVGQKGNKDFLVELSARVVRGLKGAAAAGHFCGGRRVFGFDAGEFAPDGKLVRRLKSGERKARENVVRLVPSEDKAKLAAVRYAFERFGTADVGYSALAREMEQKGFPSPTGAGWCASNLRDLLANPVYKGTSRWAATAWGKYHTLRGDEIAPGDGERKCRPKPPEEAIQIDGALEGIIPPALFDKVQRRISKREKRQNVSRAEYPLSGLLVCTHCGLPMHGTSYSGKGRDGRTAYHYTSYTCQTYAKFGPNHPRNQTCGSHTLPSAKVNRWVVRALQEEFLGPGRAELVHQIRRQLKAQAKGSKDDTKMLETRLAELDQEVGRLVKAIRQTDAPELAQELNNARADRDRVQAALEAAARYSTPQDLDREAEATADALIRLGERLDAGDPTLLREVFRQAIDRIECTWEQVVTKTGKTRCKLAEGLVQLNPVAAGIGVLGVAAPTLPR